MQPKDSGTVVTVVTKVFCGGVVILGFRSELKKDYSRGLRKKAQSEAKRSKKVVKRGLAIRDWGKRETL